LKIKGILFDKDGTILNFHGLWSEVLNELVKSICKHYQVEKVMELSSSLLTSIDVTETSIIPNGIFASGTNEDIMEAFLRVMNQSGVKVNEDSFKPFVKEEMNRLVHER